VHHSCTVNQDVQFSEFLIHESSYALDVLVPRQVNFERNGALRASPDPFDGSSKRVPVSPDDAERRPLPGQRPGDRLTDSTAGSGDDRDLSIQKSACLGNHCTF
jgi:hypothetical protein